MHTPLRTYMGTSIASAIVEAVEALPNGNGDGIEIVTFKAGENMPITCAFVPAGEYGDLIPEYAWDGETWQEIGFL